MSVLLSVKRVQAGGWYTSLLHSHRRILFFTSFMQDDFIVHIVYILHKLIYVTYLKFFILPTQSERERQVFSFLSLWVGNLNLNLNILSTHTYSEREKESTSFGDGNIFFSLFLSLCVCVCNCDFFKL